MMQRRTPGNNSAPDDTAPAKPFHEDYLSYLLAQASYSIYKEFDRAVRAAGLSSLEWRVLASLSHGEAVTIGELARIVLAQQPTLTKLIDRMVQQGLVDKRDDPADRRRTLVFETTAGRRLIKPLLAAAKAHEAEALAGFSTRDVQTFKRILNSLVARQLTASEG